MIDQSPTQFDTVYTLVRRSLAMAYELGQTEAIIVLDQAIYAKAAEVCCTKADELSRIVLSLGAFHLT